MSGTPVPSDDDEDFDIYGDLSEANVSVEKPQKALESKEKECQSLKKLVEQLQSEIAVLRKNNDKLKTDNQNLSCNISVLLKTATAEIERKDQAISELRKELDNFLFRRKNKKLSAGCRDEVSSRQSNPSINLHSLKESIRQHLDVNEVPTVSSTPGQTVISGCVPEVADINSKTGLPVQNNGHNNEGSFVRDKQVGNVKDVEVESSIKEVSKGNVKDDKIQNSIKEAPKGDVKDVKMQNSIKEVPKKRKILECSYNTDEKLCIEKPLELSDQTVTASNNETEGPIKKSVWERLGYRSRPPQKSTNAEPTKETAHARRSPITFKDNLKTKNDCPTSASSDSKLQCSGKNHVKETIFPANEPSSSLLERADQKRISPCNVYSDALQISKKTDSQRVGTSAVENGSSEVTENSSTNCSSGVSTCLPVTCDLPLKKEDCHEKERENSECVNQTDSVQSSPQQPSKKMETVQPPCDLTQEKSVPLHLTKLTPPKDSFTDVPSPGQLHEKSPISLPLLPPERPSSPFRPPLPQDDPAPLPPLPLTSPPPTPVKKPSEHRSTSGKGINESIQNYEVATVEHSLVQSSSTMNCTPLSSDVKDSNTDTKVPGRWSNENLLMQCPFKPRRRAKSVVVIESKTDEKNVSSQSSEFSKSDADAKVPIVPNKSPESKFKKTPLKKSDIHENRLTSDFRPYQPQRSVYSSRHLSSVKSFAQLPERRSPSELLSGRSGRIGRIERLTHDAKIRVRLRDRRSRSHSPPRKRVRQEEYRTRNHYNNASAKDAGRRNFVDDQECRNERSRDSKKSKSLSLRRKVPCQSEKEENISKHRSQKMTELFGESSPEPEEKVFKRKNHASKRSHGSSTEENLSKNASLSASKTRSTSPKDILSRNRKSGEMDTPIDRKRKESAGSAATCVSNGTKESDVGDSVTNNKGVNSENQVIKVRRRARSSIKLEDSEFKVHAVSISNVNNPISSSTPVQGGEGAKSKHLERGSGDVHFAGDQKKELEDVVARKLENTPLYFRERTSKQSLSDDSTQDVDSMNESNESSINADSDDTYHPKKSSKTITKRKPPKRKK